jgi:hypothetical protein
MSDENKTTGYLLVATYADGRIIQYQCSTEEERECLREWIFAELGWEPAAPSPIGINEYSGVASVKE